MPAKQEELIEIVEPDPKRHKSVSEADENDKATSKNDEGEATLLSQ